MDNFIYEMQDRQISLKPVQQAITEVTEFPEQFDTYQKEELYQDSFVPPSTTITL